MWIILVLLSILYQGILGDLIVQIQNGQVQGTTFSTPSGKTFYTWRGIPYGIPPLGNLRYLPPLKAQPWEGVLDASIDGPACVFFGGYGNDSIPSSGNSEDCLYINVYSPVPVDSNSSIEPSLPVMFWIYGGGFKVGAGDFFFYDPTPFLEENVIVVTFNYRLGAFGFLSTEDEVILGNAGLKDQWLALIWTRENIPFFGGNPLDITIFGESAGAMSVGYHIVSPMSRNLFKAAIMESGSALSNYIEPNSKDFTYTLANLVDPTITKTNTTAEIRNVLQAADADLIVNLTLSTGQDVRPVIEVESDFSFLSKPLYEALESGDIVPIIIGYNSEETIGYIQDIETATNIANWYNSNPQLLVSNTHIKENVSAAEVGEEVRQQYVGKDGDFGKNLAAFLNWWSDDQFLRGSTKHAILQSKYSQVYLYQFSYYGTLSTGHPYVSGYCNTYRTLVWIYGGGFYAGFSDFGFYDPTAFLEEDVIVVTFNYRLGTFGFLSTEDDVVLGNAGLKDQNLALKWVNENIAFFGGNPQDVTIFGESAGGLSVGYHIVSPMSKGLFKSAIMESGSAVSNLHQTNARILAVNLANQLDSSITNASTSEQIRDVLQAASVDDITRLTTESLGPVTEIESDQSFITTPLYETLEAGDINKVPIIIGYNSMELIVAANDTASAVQQAGFYDSYPQLLTPTSMKLKENASSEEIGQLIHDQYAGKDGLFTENLAAFFEILSDNFMGRSCEKHAALQYKFTPVYMYQFSFYGTQSRGNLIIPGAGKVGHAQEVGYLFNISNKPLETEADYLTRRRFVKLWTNFAKTSNPTPDDDSAELLQNVKWEPITEDNIQYLDIDENLEMKPNRKVAENALWNNLWETYSYRPYNTF